MKFIDLTAKTGRGLALSAAIIGAVSLAAAPAAQAREWHGGGHWHGGGWHHHGGGWGGAAVGLGLLGGALAGAAIASSPYYYGYSYPYYGYGYGYPYYYGY
jgi:hypothetical protein